ncbi:MAG: 5'-nucleotidase C-terminal domain-containing protein [Thermotogota bacterium]
MNKKNIIWGVFIIILMLIISLIFIFLGNNDEKVDQNYNIEDSNNSQTIYEDDFVPGDSIEITPDSTSNLLLSESDGQNENQENNSTDEENIDLIETNADILITKNSTSNEKIDKNTHKEIEEIDVSFKLYITSNINGDFTTYDYDYDKKDYDGSFSQLAKIIDDKVNEVDILLNIGDTFLDKQNNKTVDSFLEAFDYLKYDLWLLSENDVLKIDDLNLNSEKFLTPGSSETLNNITFYNKLDPKDNLENDILISLNKEEQKNKLIISNKFNDSKKEFLINNSTESLYQIDYKLTKEGSNITDDSTLTKIPVKNDDRVILPLHSIENIFREYHQESIEELESIIAEVVNGDFFEEKKIDQIDSYHLKPTKISDLINEVQLHYANKIFDSEVKISSTPIYVENLKLSNQISKRYINRFYPEKNSLSIVELTGKQLKEYLEWSVEFYNKFEKEHLTITRTNKSHKLYDIFKGLNFEINISKDFGNRIENLTDSASNNILDDKKYLLATNSARAENEFSNSGEIFSDKLPNLLASSKDIEKFKDYYITDFIEEYIVDYKNGIIKSETDENWKITGNNWNKIHRIKAEKIFKEGNLSIDNRVPLTYEEIKELAEKIILKYTVKSGDWLLKISRIYGVNYNDIAEKNNIENPNLIYPNQVFIIPED